MKSIATPAFRVLSLLIISSVSAFLTSGTSQREALLVESEDASSVMGTSQREVLRHEAEQALATATTMDALLKLKFSEPLPVALARAQDKASKLPLNQAIAHFGKPLPSEVNTFIQNSSFAGSAASSSSGLGSLQESRVFDKAMAFLNNEFKMARERMDIKLFECGFFKLEKEGLLYETQDTLDEIAQDISLAEASIEHCQGEIEELTVLLAMKRKELKDHLEVCAMIRAELEAEKAVIEEDLRVINLILDTTMTECKANPTPQKPFLIQACTASDGTTVFQSTSKHLQDQAAHFKSLSSKQAFQQMLFQVYSGPGAVLPTNFNMASLMSSDADDFDDEDEAGTEAAEGSHSFVQTSKLRKLRQHKAPAAAAPTKDKAIARYRNAKCPIGVPPNCPKLLDKLGQMKGAILDALQEKTSELEAHNTECKMISDNLNSQIAVYLNQLTVWNTQLAKASGWLASLQVSQRKYQQIKHEVCNELREKYTECYMELMEILKEICGLLKIRQSVYNRVKLPNLKPGDAQIMIQDCQMGDWVVGPCSSTCVDMYGNPGKQQITRTPVAKWDPTTPEGKYGASCPPSLVTRDCSNVPCPIDCQMGEWSGWSKCSKDCGGGQQGRSRPIEVEAEYGGKACPGSSEERLCNTGSCDVDCVLADWGAWSPCTKSCKWRSTAKPGSQTRARGIKVAAKGAGKCPKPRTRQRYQWQQCNNYNCPRDIQCVAEMDVVMLLDGSGSLWYRYGPVDRNWKLTQKFTEELIGASKMATIDSVGRAKGGLRYGVVLFSWNPSTVSPITHKKDELLTKVKAMKWPKGATFTDRGLLRCQTLFNVGSSRNRQQVIMLVTDGRATNRWRARLAAAKVRKGGIRIILIPVKNALRMQKEMCGWASRPCNENMIMTPSWRMLISKLKWYLTTMCSVIEVPKKP